MNKNDYKELLEKKAAYDTGESVPKKIVSSYAENKVNDAKKMALKGVGAAVGTGLALRGGAPLSKALVNGGVGGMAIGDIAGSAIFPTMSLYKKHKEEFGDGPDAKTVGKLMAANVLPTAGMWGAVYGTKKGLQYRNSIANGLNKKVDLAKSTGKKIGANYNAIKDDEAYMMDLGRRLRSGNASVVKDANKEIRKKSLNAVFGPIKDSFSEGTGIKNKSDAIRVAKNTIVAGAAPFVANEVVGMPAVYATPSNLVNAKKRRLVQEQGDVDGI